MFLTRILRTGSFRVRRHLDRAPPRMSHMRHKTAAVQHEPALGRVEANLGGLLALTEEAVRRRRRLIVLPEMATVGYAGPWSIRERSRSMAGRCEVRSRVHTDEGAGNAQTPEGRT